MELPIPIAETIQRRRSARTYDDRLLMPQDREALLACMKQVDNPFGIPVHEHIVDKKLDAGGEKLGTCGVVKGASAFPGVSIPDTELAPLAAGYEFESLILLATRMGLGTVRLAPSATNAQPWRVRKTQDACHFYADCKPGLSKGEEVIKQVDLGIALSHFHQSALESGMTGAFESLPQGDVRLPANIHYMISWCIDK